MNYEETDMKKNAVPKMELTVDFAEIERGRYGLLETMARTLAKDFHANPGRSYELYLGIREKKEAVPCVDASAMLEFFRRVAENDFEQGRY